MIDLGNTPENTNGVQWTVPDVDDLDQKTILVWIYPNALPTAGYWSRLVHKHDGTDGWLLDWMNTTTGYQNRVVYWHKFSSAWGGWYFPEPTLTVGAMNLIGVSYDRTDAANDPAGYLNGVSKTMTETDTPSGTANSDAGLDVTIGKNHYITLNDRGGAVRYYSVLIYDRIFTATEHANAYNSRLAIPDMNGLVFAADFLGASGGIEDGDTLGASNQFTDLISGARGTPNGSPVFRADDYLIHG